MSNYQGRMGPPAHDPTNPYTPAPAPRQDSMQHAVDGADPVELRRAFLVYGTAGDAAHAGKEAAR